MEGGVDAVDSGGREAGEKVVAATMTLHFARAVSHEQIIEEFGKQEGVLFILEV